MLKKKENQVEMLETSIYQIKTTEHSISGQDQTEERTSEIESKIEKLSYVNNP
jgi:hypothetical protein